MSDVPQDCIVCRLMMRPRKPQHIIRWVGNGPYRDFAVTFPVCEQHSNLSPDNEKLEKLIEALLGLNQDKTD